MTRQAFIDNLLTAAREKDGPVSVVIALRSDLPLQLLRPLSGLRAALAGDAGVDWPDECRRLRCAIDTGSNNHRELGS